jgi:hypothetical protein
MESRQDVRHAIRPGDWAASIDLKDAYFHVPIDVATRKYLHFGLSPGGFHDQVFTCPWALPCGGGGGSSSGCARLLALVSLSFILILESSFQLLA